MGQALLCILDFPGSLYDRGLLSDNNAVFEYVKDLSFGRSSRNILAPAVKDVILMAQDCIESEGDLTRILVSFS